MLKRIFVGALFVVFALVGLTGCGRGQAGDKQNLEGMQGIIIAAGEFWEDWLSYSGPFDLSFVEPVSYISMTAPIQHGFIRMSENAPFQSVDQIRSYLLQYYTEDGLEDMGGLGFFMDYQGRLYMYNVRTDDHRGRPRWQDATFTLRQGEDSIVDAIIPIGDMGSNKQESRSFVFVAGRINNVTVGGYD